ncbi:MAG TPA: glycosyltransferase [Patescibacteria group bacterium]|nr:glycosyltransferase [Patescibacteria group bacterium]
MKVALVHDYLSQDGGAERVLKSLHEIWPEAPIFVLFHDRDKLPFSNAAKIEETFLARMPFIKSSFPWYLPLMPLATEKHDLKNYEVVLSTSSIFAKGVITNPNTLHISYCHTPPRFLWAEGGEYLSDLKRSRLVKMLLPGFIHRLRIWDQLSTQRVDEFIANSKTVSRRILKYYRRGSEVIYPPVDTNLYQPNQTIGDYFVAGGRLVPYKRIDLVVKVFNRLKLPLKIFGIGPELKLLKKISKPNIEFLGKISEEAKRELLSHAQAFIHPQMEDFGITPVEAMAAGRPVIALGQGGATETVIPNETGAFFKEQTWESLLDAVLNFKAETWDSQKIHNHSHNFGSDKFKTKIQSYVSDRFEEFKKGFHQPNLNLGDYGFKMSSNLVSPPDKTL